MRAVVTGLIPRFDGIDSTDGGVTERYSVSVEEQRGVGAWLTTAAYAVAYRLDLFSNFTYFLDDRVNGDQFQQADRRTRSQSTTLLNGQIAYRLSKRAQLAVD